MTEEQLINIRLECVQMVLSQLKGAHPMHHIIAITKVLENYILGKDNAHTTS